MRNWIICLAILLLCTSCTSLTEDQKQSFYHIALTSAGALTGQAIGKDTKSTLIGTGAGYVAGGLTKEFVFPESNYQQQGQGNQRVASVPSGVYPMYPRKERLYSERYIKNVRRDYHKALRMIEEYSGMARRCNDYYFRRSSAFNAGSRYGRIEQGERDSYRRQAANDCARAKSRMAWARAAISEYEKLASEGALFN